MYLQIFLGNGSHSEISYPIEVRSEDGKLFYDKKWQVHILKKNIIIYCLSSWNNMLRITIITFFSPGFTKELE